VLFAFEKNGSRSEQDGEGLPSMPNSHRTCKSISFKTTPRSSDCSQDGLTCISQCNFGIPCYHCLRGAGSVQLGQELCSRRSLVAMRFDQVGNVLWQYVHITLVSD
jgi:hypothetical protein